MNIFLLGLMYSEKTLNEAHKLSRTNIQMAPQTFQKNLIDGFKKTDGTEIKVFNIPPIGSYPKNYKRLFMPKIEWGDGNVQVGFINLPFIKRAIQTRKLIRVIEKNLKNCDLSDTCILIYHVFEPFLKCAKVLKKKYPSLNVSLIATDVVPGRSDRQRYMSGGAIKRGDRLVSLAKSCDSFVLLTEHMKVPLEVGERPYTVVECICDAEQMPAAPTDGEKNICLYTGTVDEDFGIKDLTEAFKGMKNAELWICGGGDCAQYLKDTCKEYPNIKYFGFVKQERIAELRNRCDFLINPRRPSGTYTKYSFPSKTAEYMLTEKPVIMYKLEGIPNEYDEHLNYLTACDANGIKKELAQIFSVDYTLFKKKAQGARAFMENGKTAKIQARRIMEMLKDKVREERKYATRK